MPLWQPVRFSFTHFQDDGYVDDGCKDEDEAAEDEDEDEDDYDDDVPSPPRNVPPLRSARSPALRSHEFTTHDSLSRLDFNPKSSLAELSGQPTHSSN
ncbi:hypothetical protein AWZ03_010189 [Drosophila navojoa]|uniref:Uncharacterized protein n=1 Tax=Drosophila navojoa TaxID=7232 RepID=A0A484B429_DRONA|nr:hypothetical protein AWZ03_010189 [Drosophila navojoa]